MFQLSIDADGANPALNAPDRRFSKWRASGRLRLRLFAANGKTASPGVASEASALDRKPKSN